MSYGTRQNRWSGRSSTWKTSWLRCTRPAANASNRKPAPDQKLDHLTMVLQVELLAVWKAMEIWVGMFSDWMCSFFKMWWRLYYCTLLNHLIFVTNWQSPSTAAAQTSTFSEITPNQSICTVIMSLTVTTAVFDCFLLLFSRDGSSSGFHKWALTTERLLFRIDWNQHWIRQDRMKRILIYLEKAVR